ERPAAFVRISPASAAEGHQVEASGCARSRPRSPPGRSSAVAWLRTRHSGSIGGILASSNPIHALAIALFGLQMQPELLAHRGGPSALAGQEERADQARCPLSPHHTRSLCAQSPAQNEQRCCWFGRRRSIFWIGSNSCLLSDAARWPTSAQGKIPAARGPELH